MKPTLIWIALPSGAMIPRVGKASTLYFLAISTFSGASASIWRLTNFSLKNFPTSGCVKMVFSIFLQGTHQVA